MNQNSLISRYLSEHEDWRQHFDDLGIKYKFSPDNFVIFNYGIACDFANPLVQEARGIILNASTLDVVCWPFRKFGNYTESYHDEIDWKTARVQEKVDGSIVKLWYHSNRGWVWATNGVIYAEDASIESLWSRNFLEVIQKADNYRDIPFTDLDPTKTYMFELVGPENRVVINYKVTHLYHIGTRSNITGHEFNDDIGIEKPKEYAVNTFEDCLNAVEHLNTSEDGLVDHEGFVVVDGAWHRVKIKSSAYLFYHHYTNGVLFNKSKILQLLQSDDINIQSMIDQWPEYEEIFKFYQNEIRRVEDETQSVMDEMRSYYGQTDRKSVAMRYGKNRYASFGFRGLGNEKTAKELLSECSRSTYESLINDWKDESK